MAESKTCCCSCVSVRAGTKIIGAYWLVQNVINLVVYSLHLALLVSDETSNPFEMWWTYAREHGLMYKEPDPEIRARIDDAYANHRTMLALLTVVVLKCSLANLIFSGLMVYGAIKNGPIRCVIPWLGFNSLLLVVSVVASLIGMGYALTKGPQPTAVYTLIPVVLVIWVVYAYLYRVVYLYIRQLKNQEQEPFDNVGLIKP